MFKFAIGIFLTVPAAWAQGQQISYADAIIPQMPVGCGWTATVILVNLTGHSIDFTVNFWPDGGKSDSNAQPVPRVIPIVGMGPTPSVSGAILASGSYSVRVDETARDNTTGCNGWAEINSSEALGGYVLLNQKYSINTQQAIGGIQVHQTTDFRFETTVPVSSRFASKFVVPFDATAFTPAIALVNPSFQVSATVDIHYRDNLGNEICTETRVLQPGQQQVFALSSLAGEGSGGSCGPGYQSLQGRTGVAEFTTANLELSGFGLQFGQLGFVSYPAQSPIGR